MTAPLDFVANAFSQQDPARFYNDKAKEYDSLVALPMASRHENSLKQCLKYLKKDEKILDIGAGTGKMGELLKEKGFTSVDGLDPSVEMLAVAREKDVYKDYIVGLIDPTIPSPVPDHTYDAVITVGCFGPGHLNPDCFPCLIKMVKPGGKILFGNRADWLYDQSATRPDWPYDMDQIITDYVDDNKWRVLEKHFGSDPEPTQNGVYITLEVAK